MHGVLYVCLPRSEARSSLQARKGVREYLTREGFDTQLRWSGCCDYFEIGGRWSGRLSLLRLRHVYQKKFDGFWQCCCSSKAGKVDPQRLFRTTFPEFRGQPPLCRERVGEYGEPDDAQVMDGPLFEQLKAGFSQHVDLSHEIEQPNVIFNEDADDFEWPKTPDEAAKFWVVVIDYHY